MTQWSFHVGKWEEEAWRYDRLCDSPQGGWGRCFCVAGKKSRKRLESVCSSQILVVAQLFHSIKEGIGVIFCGEKTMRATAMAGKFLQQLDLLAPILPDIGTHGQNATCRTEQSHAVNVLACVVEGDSFLLCRHIKLLWKVLSFWLQGFFTENKGKLIVGCLESVLAEVYSADDVDSVWKCESQLQCLHRLFASKSGFQAFTAVPGWVCVLKLLCLSAAELRNGEWWLVRRRGNESENLICA